MNEKPVSTNFAVIGSGSWATALVKILSENLPKVGWWIRSEKLALHVQKYGCNPSYLTSVKFSSNNLDVRTGLHDLVRDYQVIVLAVPSLFLKEVFKQIPISLGKEKKWISSVKGLLSGDIGFVSDYLKEYYQVESSHIGILAGPCHAEEIAMKRLSYLTLAFADVSLAQSIADALKRPYVNVSVSSDTKGIEYAMTLKNIYALASGITGGLGYGANFQAVFISNALQEMVSFLDFFCPYQRDVSRSAYLGDLLVTAYSSFSRNRMLGCKIGKGLSVSEAVSSMPMMAEGYFTSKGLMKFIENHSLSMPIAQGVYKILYENASAKEVFRSLSNLFN